MRVTRLRLFDNLIGASIGGMSSLLEPKLQDVTHPAIFRIIGDCGTLQDLRINWMCALCPLSLVAQRA
jgi:hypothetical protein